MCCSYQEKPVFNEAAEKEKILALHHAQRDYHFGKDSVAFAKQLSDQFISVNRGFISQLTFEENLKRYNGYFSTVEFLKWDDLADPIIRFSDDGSIAYTIVDKEVKITYESESGEQKEETTHYSWVSIYRKYPDGWKIDCVASTNEPSIEKTVSEQNE